MGNFLSRERKSSLATVEMVPMITLGFFSSTSAAIWPGGVSSKETKGMFQDLQTYRYSSLKVFLSKLEDHLLCLLFNSNKRENAERYCP